MADGSGVKVDIAQPEVRKEAHTDVEDAEDTSPFKKFFLLSSWFLSFSGWVVFLAGVCLFQKDCIQAVQPNTPSPIIDCAREYALDWWNVWLAFLGIVIYLAAFFTNWWMRTRVAVLAFFVVVISQLTVETNALIQLAVRSTSQNVYISGSVIMQAGFYFSILVLGIN
mmetsp:Transcript_8866/g.14530  ORF Transcript_8866/g.14530 Transcript_8866/m.14530 type:complete len:168 (+) Transcript_8866:155-658(+)|eukprot:CAMPEP_0184658308 /NCGR_PEP_ID=MMETSP0308-20130426/24849_1 /TAXON_ID=38269 /ORGANISM="Gloeochaete witrockiana, Strain SAG 46.84" /LENGTH=167 /DNA_ID=CAMNT_0027097217 /DNA_START=106 /DNA_END=609 /DNA_ORIENTATION=+